MTRIEDLPGESIARCAARFADASCWVVGLSGGLDSTALLLAVAEQAAALSLPPLRAIHVNHGLHPQAAAWQAHCGQLCAGLNIPLESRQVSVTRAGGGPEAAARDARYEVFAELLPAGGCLLLGHQLDDQIETFFLRLLRGAGAEGLSGMPDTRSLAAGCLHRPFLHLPRSVLKAYLHERDTAWIEDPSNGDDALDRNYLRAEVLPAFADRWPGYRQTVSRAMRHLAATAAAASYDGLPLAVNGFGDPGFTLEPLRDLAPEQAALKLRGWLRSRGAGAVDSARLFEFLRQLSDAEAPASPRLAGGGWDLRRYGDAVYLTPRPALACLPEGWCIAPGETVSIDGVGEVQLQPSPAPAQEPAYGEGTGGLRLRLRSGGEKIRLPGRAHRSSLKQLLQESRVPPWWRQRMPLLVSGDEVLAAGDAWRDARSPWQLAWRRDSLRYVD